MADLIDNNFDPATVSDESETLPMSSIINMYIRGAQVELNTAFPARVVTVSPGVVSVQPLIKRTLAFKPTPPAEQVVALPVLADVPLWSPRGTGYAMQLPVAVGDLGLVVCCQRSLDVWKVSAGADPVDPQDPRIHHLSDGVFFPGAYPIMSPFTPTIGAADPTAFILENGATQFRVTPSGQFNLKNAAGNDLLELTNEILTQLTNINTLIQAITVNTVFGPQPIINAPAFAALTPLLAAITAKLATLIAP